MTANIALVGCGKWGQNYAKLLSEMAVLGAVLTSNKQTTQCHSRAYGLEPRGWQDICNDPQIDGVVIATPPKVHEKYALEALRAGKHVLIEKPMTLTAASTQSVIEASLHHERHLMVGHLMLYHAAFLTMLKRVKAGEIGPVRRISSRRTSLRPDEGAAESIWSLAPHDLSMACSLVAGAPSSIDVTYGAGVNIQLSFEEAVEVDIYLAKGAAVKERVFRVEGAQGVFVFDDIKPWSEKLAYVPYGPGDIQYITLAPDEPLRLQCLGFLNAIKGEEPCDFKRSRELSIATILESLVKHASKV